MSPQDAAAEALAELLPTLPGLRDCPELQGLREHARAAAAEGSRGAKGAPATGPASETRAGAGSRGPARAKGPHSPPAPATQPADRRLREFFRRHPALGKRDRQQIGDWIFDVLRNLRLYASAAAAAGVGGAVQTPAKPSAGDPVRELIRIARAAAEQPAGVCASPAPAFGQKDLAEAVRYSLPDWLWERLQAAYGARAGPIAQALLQPAPIELRVNLLRGKADVLQSRLAEAGIEAEKIDRVPTGLRVSGHPALEKLDLFERGWFEIQEAGSQGIADFCDARRGQLVVDFCAGAGGKTLAMGAAMRNLGKVLAFDTGEERLSQLMPRARRAGLDIVQTVRITGLSDPRLARYRQRADVVLVDAPCSGTGTIRRSPDLKWRLSRERLLEHVQEQQAILAAASALVRPGGKLVYATCSLLPEENEQQVDRFREPGFESAQFARWLPGEGPSGGFFAAKWVFRGAATAPAATIR